jgi:hypothetical protein
MAKEGQITTKTGLPVLFGAIADLGENQEKSKDERAKMSDEISKLSGDVKDLSSKIDTVNGCMKTLSDKVEKNPAMKVGVFILNYRWLSMFLGFVGLTMLTLWSLPGVRIGVMAWIGMPKELITFLNP